MLTLKETGVCSICEYPFEDDCERIPHPIYEDSDICKRCYISYYDYEDPKNLFD